MHIIFGWGVENPEPNQMPYIVTNYNLSLELNNGSQQLSNCVPGTITMSLKIPPHAYPATDLLTFAADQHNLAKMEGMGKIAIFPGKDVGSSIQEIHFSRAWIVDIDMGGSTDDEYFNVNLVIAATEVTVSQVDFTHRQRADYFALSDQ